MDARMQTYYRRAKKLAAALGCQIEREKMGSFYWLVYGPEEIYGGGDDEYRRDPIDGSHVCADWIEVLDKLAEYQEDLRFHRLGLSGADTDAILRAARETPLVGGWLQNWHDPARGLILADWWEGRSPGSLLPDRLRAAVRAVLAQPATWQEVMLT